MVFFDYKRIAEGYAKSRPQYHVLVMDMLKKEMGISNQLESGLDVGCGAGLSTTALKKVCKNVVGADASAEMIRSARKSVSDQEIQFIQCGAEALEFEQDSFDIVTVAGAINWINEAVFLPLTNNILKNSGILLVYDNFITDEMEGCEAYTRWWNEQYLVHFPKPPRKENVWTNEDVLKYGFIIQKQEKYRNQIQMSKKEYIDFMLTQSNVVAKVEEQGQPLDKTREWFDETLEKVFQGERKSLVFEGYNWYLKQNRP